MNFLERLLKRRQDPTVHWGSLKPPLPDFDWNAMRFGPLGFGSDINEAAFLGRADRIDWVDNDYFILLYAPEGFQIEFDHGKLAYLGFFIGPDTSLPEHGALKFSRPTIRDGEEHTMVLTPDVDATGVRQWIGEPISEDTDEEETILNYSRHRISMEFELDGPSGRLKRWNLFPEETNRG